MCDRQTLSEYLRLRRRSVAGHPLVPKSSHHACMMQEPAKVPSLAASPAVVPCDPLAQAARHAGGRPGSVLQSAAPREMQDSKKLQSGGVPSPIFCCPRASLRAGSPGGSCPKPGTTRLSVLTVAGSCGRWQGCSGAAVDQWAKPHPPCAGERRTLWRAEVPSRGVSIAGLESHAPPTS